MTKIWELADGVIAPNGCDPDGIPEPAWIIVCHHVTAGMMIYGPFESKQSAANWRREHAREELEDYCDPPEWKIVTERIVSPTIYVGAIRN